MLLQLNDKMQKKLEDRERQGNLRTLKYTSGLIDFTSNDYLGLAYFEEDNIEKAQHGSTGSRLLTGHSQEIEILEAKIAAYHQAEAALLFNTGYTANLGLIDTILDEEATVIYDLHCHASLQDGMRLAKGKSLPFLHNDVSHLEQRLKKNSGDKALFVAVESVYSMDGSLAPLREIAALCSHYNAALIVDEAHAIGVFGEKGSGRVLEEGLSENVFARVFAYGKAFGAFGGAVLGSKLLKDYLINFARPFGYSTALPPGVIHTLTKAYRKVEESDDRRKKLFDLIDYFHQLARMHSVPISYAQSPIQSIVIPGNLHVKKASQFLADKGFDVRPVLSPTVKKGSEILRLILHSFNPFPEIEKLVQALKALKEIL